MVPAISVPMLKPPSGWGNNQWLTFRFSDLMSPTPWHSSRMSPAAPSVPRSWPTATWATSCPSVASRRTATRSRLSALGSTSPAATPRSAPISRCRRSRDGCASWPTRFRRRCRSASAGGIARTTRLRTIRCSRIPRGKPCRTGTSATASGPRRASSSAPWARAITTWTCSPTKPTASGLACTSARAASDSGSRTDFSRCRRTRRGASARRSARCCSTCMRRSVTRIGSS